MTPDLEAEFAEARRRIFATIDASCDAAKRRMREFLAGEHAKAQAIARHGYLNNRSAAQFRRYGIKRLTGGGE